MGERGEREASQLERRRGKEKERRCEGKKGSRAKNRGVGGGKEIVAEESGGTAVEAMDRWSGRRAGGGQTMGGWFFEE